MATADNMSLQNTQLRNGDYFAIIVFLQPRSQGLLRFQDGGREKTLAHTVIPPAKYSKNRGVFCHVTQ